MSLELLKLNENLYLVTGQNAGRFPCAHSFLVQDRLCALIDSGCGFEILKEIRESFSVDLVINSHGHPDHSSGNWLFPDVPLYAPKEGTESHGRLLPLSHRFFGPGPLADHWRGWIRQVMGFVDHPATNFFSDGHIFDFGHLKLKAIHAPGHTSDHYCFFEPENRILLSFDIDFTSFGPWYGNLESNLSEFKRSIDIIRGLDPKLVASSHLHPIGEGIEQALQDYTSVIDKRRRKIIELVSHGISRSALVDAAPVYRRHLHGPELFRFFEGRMIDLHLEELLAQGIIDRQGEEYRLASSEPASSLEPLRRAVWGMDSSSCSGRYGNSY
ncbi:MAG: MBL fold metallo-hydrolase [Desulfomonile tiedjei]|uniref:MBL fold metallo-hydrolase n=1 Tax=Desulfomonile tiedjei TaxID=2358 RepID=A0A9D6UZ84_9BACT|nr:MBL fold metallo-hydrolase [Desulfomonile tiedjei]